MGKKKVGFAAEMEELLEARAPKELDVDEQVAPDLDEEDDWQTELLGEKGEVKSKGLRMRGALGAAFTEGTYKGKVVDSGSAFGGAGDETTGPVDLDYGSDVDGMGSEASNDSFGVMMADGTINEAAISSKMDAIFGDLDGGSEDDEPGETYEAFAAKMLKKKPKVRRVGKRNREDFEEGDEFGDDDAEAEDEIAKQLREIREATEKADEGVFRLAAESDQKAAHARNQYQIWSKLVACRIHLQQPMSWAASLPASYASDAYSPSTAAPNPVSSSLMQLLEDFHQLRTSLLKQTPSMKTSTPLPAPKNLDQVRAKSSSYTDPDLSRYWKLCVSSASNVSGAVDAALDQWHAKAHIASQSQEALKGSSSAVSQIKSTLSREYERLLKKTQKNRTGRLPFGHPAAAKAMEEAGAASAPERLKQKQVHADLLLNPDAFDDSDFYSWLLTDYTHNCTDAHQTSAAELVDAQRLAKDPGRLLIDKKRSKARKLSFEPIPKLVGYSIPNPRETPEMVDGLYKTLFHSA